MHEKYQSRVTCLICSHRILYRCQMSLYRQIIQQIMSLFALPAIFCSTKPLFQPVFHHLISVIKYNFSNDPCHVNLPADFISSTQILQERGSRMWGDLLSCADTDPRTPSSPLLPSSLPSLTIQLTPSAHMAALPLYHPPPLCLSTVGVCAPSLQCCNITHPASSLEVTAVIKKYNKKQKNATKLVDAWWCGTHHDD